jgi:N6-L-threonylcarbamoyladenine synthase
LPKEESCCIGIDTSNYTTSAALYVRQSDFVISKRQLIPVPKGGIGVRQSDAVFHHVRQLPALIEELLAGGVKIEGVGASVRPRPIDGSYMPCFEVGASAAKMLSSALSVPLFTCSHQEGHIAAALYSAGCTHTIGDRFIAFHVSGGTTEAVMTERTDSGYRCTKLCGSLDLKAGQVIDRCANMLDLPFPGGPSLAALAETCEETVKCRASMKGPDCCLSGVENKCADLMRQGADYSLIARTCIEYIRVSLEEMAKGLLAEYGDIPLLFAGGVMSNRYIREAFRERFGAYFAAPEYSSDNAAGVAILTSTSLTAN